MSTAQLTSMFTCEVKIPGQTSYYQAFMRDINDTQILVSYVDDWRPMEWVDPALVRPAAPPHSPDEFELQTGMVVEALASLPSTHPHSWWRVTVINAQPLLVRFLDLSTPHSDLYEKMYLRPLNMEPPINHSQLCRVVVPAPAHLLASGVLNHHLETLRERFNFLLINLDLEAGAIIGVGGAAERVNFERAVLALVEYALRPQNMSMISRLHEVQARHEATMTDKFSIDPELIGYIIGKGGANVKAAESIPGVVYVQVNGEQGQVTIGAETAEAVASARRLLYIVQRSVEVPFDKLQHLSDSAPGQRQGGYQSLEASSGARRIYRQWEESKSNSGMATLIVVGNPEAVELALTMIDQRMSFGADLQLLRARFTRGGKPTYASKAASGNVMLSASTVGSSQSQATVESGSRPRPPRSTGAPKGRGAGSARGGDRRRGGNASTGSASSTQSGVIEAKTVTLTNEKVGNKSTGSEKSTKTTPKSTKGAQVSAAAASQSTTKAVEGKTKKAKRGGKNKATAAQSATETKASEAKHEAKSEAKSETKPQAKVDGEASATRTTRAKKTRRTGKKPAQASGEETKTATASNDAMATQDNQEVKEQTPATAEGSTAKSRQNQLNRRVKVRGQRKTQDQSQGKTEGDATESKTNTTAEKGAAKTEGEKTEGAKSNDGKAGKRRGGKQKRAPKSATAAGSEAAAGASTEAPSKTEGNASAEAGTKAEGRAKRNRKPMRTNKKGSNGASGEAAASTAASESTPAPAVSNP